MAFWAMVSDAVCCERGMEMAHPLFWQRNTVGVRYTPAKFIASWKSPSEVAPSPEDRQGYGVGSLQPLGPGDAHRVDHVPTHRDRGRKGPDPFGRMAPPFVTHPGEKQVLPGVAVEAHRRRVPVAGHQPVPGRQRRDGPDLGRFLPLVGCVGGEPPLALEGRRLVVVQPRLDERRVSGPDDADIGRRQAGVHTGRRE